MGISVGLATLTSVLVCCLRAAGVPIPKWARILFSLAVGGNGVEGMKAGAGKSVVRTCARDNRRISSAFYLKNIDDEPTTVRRTGTTSSSTTSPCTRTQHRS